MAVLPDGQRALSSSNDGSLKLWDLETGDCLMTYFTDGFMTACTAVSNNTFLASDSLGHLHFLHLEGNLPISSPIKRQPAPLLAEQKVKLTNRSFFDRLAHKIKRYRLKT